MRFCAPQNLWRLRRWEVLWWRGTEDQMGGWSDARRSGGAEGGRRMADDGWSEELMPAEGIGIRDHFAKHASNLIADTEELIELRLCQVAIGFGSIKPVPGLVQFAIGVG